MKNIILSLSFTSRIPLGKLFSGEPDFKKAAIHFPLAGYLAFGMFGGAYMPLMTVFHDGVVAKLIALIVVYFFFNLFHFDGFMDSVDGLLSQKPKEKMLEIMRSGTAGPMGVAAGVFYLALKIYLVVKIGVIYFAAAFVLARWGMVFSAVIGKPARPEGLGALILPLPGRYLALASLYLVPLLIGFKIPVLLPLCAVLLCDTLLVRGVTRKIDGLTGDTFGLIVEVNELLVLLICSTGWL
jgi:adenosylcobinamide-GDP ribazoletransferase